MADELTAEQAMMDALGHMQAMADTHRRALITVWVALGAVALFVWLVVTRR